MACVAKRRGRYVIDFYDQSGKRRWRTLPKGTTKKEATEILRDIEKKVRQGTFTAVRNLPTFSELADLWLASKEAGLRHSTYEQYRGHVDNHLKPAFGSLKIIHITFEMIENYKKQALLNGVATPTLRKILVTLGGILKYAVRVRYIDHNPVMYVEKPRGKSTHKENTIMHILYPTDIRALISAAFRQRDRVLFMTAVLTGMREGELLGLKWSDFDWIHSQVLVRRTYNHGRFYEPKTKNSKRRIDLPPELIHELRKWKLACPKGELSLVFPTSGATPENSNNMLKRNFYPALRRAGLPKIRFHDLRHTYASLLIDQGEHPKYIQSQMGHSSIKVTMDVYGHLMKDVNSEAASRLGKNVFGSNFDESSSKMVAENGKGADNNV